MHLCALRRLTRSSLRSTTRSTASGKEDLKPSKKNKKTPLCAAERGRGELPSTHPVIATLDHPLNPSGKEDLKSSTINEPLFAQQSDVGVSLLILTQYLLLYKLDIRIRQIITRNLCDRPVPVYFQFGIDIIIDVYFQYIAILLHPGGQFPTAILHSKLVHPFAACGFFIFCIDHDNVVC
jgi:hypothetical protein